MIPKSCRLFGQGHATKQVIRAKWRFDLIPIRSRIGGHAIAAARCGRHSNCHFSTRSASFRQVAAISASKAFAWGSGVQKAMASHSAARARYHSTRSATNSRTIPARNSPAIGQMRCSKFSSEKGRCERRATLLKGERRRPQIAGKPCTCVTHAFRSSLEGFRLPRQRCPARRRPFVHYFVA